MNGAQKAIYQEATQFLQQQEANLSDLSGEDTQQIKAILLDAKVYQGNRMQQVSQQLEALKTQLAKLREQEIEQPLPPFII